MAIKFHHAAGVLAVGDVVCVHRMVQPEGSESWQEAAEHVQVTHAELDHDGSYLHCGNVVDAPTDGRDVPSLHPAVVYDKPAGEPVPYVDPVPAGAETEAAEAPAEE